MDDPFASPARSISRQRSRPNLAIPLPALPSSRSLSNGIAGDNDEDEADIPPVPALPSRRNITGSELRQHLSALLEQKTAQLQMLGQMGQEMVKQQSELEERMRGFDETSEDDGEVGEGTKQRLTELDQAVDRWERENEGMMRELGSRVS